MSSRRTAAIGSVLLAGAVAVFLINTRGCRQKNVEEEMSQRSLDQPDISPEEPSATPGLETAEPTMDAIVIRVTSTSAGIVSVKQFAGEAKLQRDVQREGRLYYRVLNGEDEMVAEGSFADPLSLHYDTVIEGTDGELAGGRIRLPSAEILVRIPSDTGAKTIELTDYTEDPEGVFLGKLSL